MVRDEAGGPWTALAQSPFAPAGAASAGGSEALGTIIVLAPLISTALIWFWIGSMNLFQDPAGSLFVLSLLTVLGTGALIAVEASLLGMGKRPGSNGKNESGPIGWFIACAVLWFIAFPWYLHKRRYFGRRSLALAGLLFGGLILEKNDRIPAAMFRYRSARSICELETNTIRLAPACEFNDPFDCSASVDFEPALQIMLADKLHPSTLPAVDPALLAKVAAEPDRLVALDHLMSAAAGKEPTATEGFWRRFMSDQSAEATMRFSEGWQRELKVAAFSEVPDSLVLWAHYGDNHRGFCVEYDFAALPSEDPRRRCLFPVRYSDERFAIREQLVQLRGGGIVNPFNPILAAIHKATGWEYECEWRLVFRKNVEGGVIIPMPRPSRVLLGARMPEQERQQVCAIAAKSGFEVLQMALSATCFGLERHAPAALATAPR